MATHIVNRVQRNEQRAISMEDLRRQVSVAHKKNRELREMLSERDEMTSSLRQELVRVQQELTHLLHQVLARCLNYQGSIAMYVCHGDERLALTRKRTGVARTRHLNFVGDPNSQPSFQ